MSGDEDMTRWIQGLQGLQSFAEQAAKEAAPKVLEAIKETAAAGVGPNGESWPAKRDGDRALPNAANALSAQAIGPVVVVKLEGAYVYHNDSKGRDRRRILPEGGERLPAKIVDALTEASREVIKRTLSK